MLFWQIAFTGSFATGSKVMAAAAQLVKVIQISEISAIFLHLFLFHQTVSMTHHSWHRCSLFLWNLVGRALSLCSMTLILIKVNVTKSNLVDVSFSLDIFSCFIFKIVPRYWLLFC